MCALQNKATFGKKGVHDGNSILYSLQESDLSIRGLHNRTSSMGVMIDSQLPYLVAMDDDILSTGICIFHLKVSLQK